MLFCNFATVIDNVLFGRQSFLFYFQLVYKFGTEAEKHLLLCLFSFVDISSERSANKDIPQVRSVKIHTHCSFLTLVSHISKACLIAEFSFS